jgi:3,4-dehydroadipyl-CoA semialdehyde dehydrogenase
MKLQNYVRGEWIEGSGPGDPLVDPVTGEELARASTQGIDVAAALDFARSRGQDALGKLTYEQRAELLGKIADVLAANRAEYFRISQLNSGATEADASFDVDGGVYTMKYYAKVGRSLGAGKRLKEGAQIPLSKTGVFAGQHFLMPVRGAAVFINAFNFPAWGFCEKAAPALLSGVPIVVKPASSTAWLTQKMVADIVAAGILPAGAISILCGSARELLDEVREEDVISFTGSAQNAGRIRSHANVLKRSVRVNAEADSINSTLLGPDAAPGSDVFNLFVREVIREMTLKAGQKCTAIRRVLVPRANFAAVSEAIAAKLAEVKVGNPRNKEVKMGPVVNKVQQASCFEGLKKLKEECSVVFGGSESFQPIDADPAKSAFVQPTLLACEDGAGAKYVHDVEVFGPASTLVAYDDLNDAVDIARRGLGSLVASVFSSDAAFLRDLTLGIGDMHGRVMVVDPSVGKEHTGHGNVMPSCLHGGPGRAGGGEELAGLRALLFYHRRFVVQGPPSLLDSLSQESVDANLLYT